MAEQSPYDFLHDAPDWDGRMDADQEIDFDSFFAEAPPMDAYADLADDYDVSNNTFVADDAPYLTEEEMVQMTRPAGAYAVAPALEEIPADYLIPGPPPGAYLPSFELSAPAYPLDDQQEVVAQFKDGAGLALAGAGSGKTTVVIERTSRRLAEGVSPSGYVLLTFSRKAAAEMRTRLKERLGFDSGIEPTTFHSFFFKLIGRAPERFGVAPTFSIMDEKDQSLIFELVLDELGIKREDYPCVQWQSGYSFCKNEGLRAGTTIEDMKKIIAHLRTFLKPMDGGEPLSDMQIAQSLLNYETYTAENGLLDYDDLILRPLEAFTKDPAIAEMYAKQVKYLIVDEAQDTNMAQYELVKQLASVNKNVLMVGDDDQSIYGWRGAHPENMAQFIEDFDAQEFLIEGNYRCAPEIVRRATNQVRLNQDRLEKKPVSRANTGTPGEVNLIKAYDGVSMVKDIIDRISKAIKAGVSPNEIAILYRGNRMLSEIEQDLMKHNLPYHVAGTSKLMDRQEAKACIAIARLVLNNFDAPALWKAAKMLPGVGNKALAMLVAHCNKTGKPLLSDDGINMITTKKAREALVKFRGVINTLRKGSPAIWIETIQKELEPLEMFKSERKNNPATFRRREANIDQLDMWAKNLSCESWHEFFEILLEQEDPQKDTGKEHITVSTIHKVKGLEYKHVHFIGMSEGIFPMAPKAKDDLDNDLSRNIEEERRLAYVAMTRAKLICNFYHADRYRTIPEKRFTESSFVKEISFTNLIKIKGQPSKNNNKPWFNKQKSWNQRSGNGFGK